MKKQIIDFYANKGFHIPKLIERRPRGLTPAQVEAGAVKVFDLLERGEFIKDINIALRVWREAKTASYKEYDKDQKIITKYKPVIKTLKKERIGLWITTLLWLSAWLILFIEYYRG